MEGRGNLNQGGKGAGLDQFETLVYSRRKVFGVNGVKGTQIKRGGKH